MIGKQSSEEQPADSLRPVNPGEVLSRARKEKGLTVEEVTFHLGVTQRTIEALEKDEYEGLPSPLYVKGYIKRYCSILGIPDHDLLLAFDARSNELGLGQKELSLRLDGTPSTRHWNWKLIASIFLIITLLLAVWLVFSKASGFIAGIDGVSFWSSENQEVDEQQKVSGLQWSPAQPITEVAAPLAGNTADEEKNVRDINEQRLRDTDELVDQPVIQTVEINVVQQSWIEIFDVDGKVLLADLKSPGFRGEVSGIAPFDIILGYAAGIELYLNGQQVNIPVAGPDGTAKFKIGLIE